VTRRATYAMAAGRLPAVGHALPLLRNPLRFLRNLQGQADLVEVDLGPVRTIFITEPDLIHAMLTDRQDNFDKGGSTTRCGRWPGTVSCWRRVRSTGGSSG